MSPSLPVPTQAKLTDDLLEFVNELPADAGFDCMKDRRFLYHFEAARLLLMRQALVDAGFGTVINQQVLDFGYLHGFIPEFLQRFFPGSHFTVHDHPDSPNFRNPKYMALVQQRRYLTLVPRDINGWEPPHEQFDAIILGEVIEHLDPTTVAALLKGLLRCAKPGCALIVTTPNGAGLFNSLLMLWRRDRIVCPPIPDETMQYGHIHLWAPHVLAQTALHCGWKPHHEYYFHGREGEAFERLGEHWGSLRHQVLMRSVKWLANRKSGWKGFFVASFLPKASPCLST